MNSRALLQNKCLLAIPDVPVRSLQAFVILSVPVVGNSSENLCPGVGHLSIILEAVYIVPFFQYFTLKYAYLDTSGLQRIFLIICFQITIRVVFARSPPYTTVILHFLPLSNEIASRHRD